MLWRRYVLLCHKGAQTGVTIGCTVTCFLCWVHPGAVSSVEVSFMPLALGFLSIMVANELAQDLFYWLLLVGEWSLPHKQRRLTAETQAFLNACVFPPIFHSRKEFGAFVLPLISAGAVTQQFVESSLERSMTNELRRAAADNSTLVF